MACRQKIKTDRLDENWKILVEVAEKLTNQYKKRTMCEEDDLFQAALSAAKQAIDCPKTEIPLKKRAFLPMRKALFAAMRDEKLIRLPEKVVCDMRKDHADEHRIDALVAKMSDQSEEDETVMEEITRLTNRMERHDYYRNMKTKMEDENYAAEPYLMECELENNKQLIARALKIVPRTPLEKIIVEEFFLKSISARRIADLAGVSHTTINTLIRDLRVRFLKELDGEIEFVGIAWEYGTQAKKTRNSTQEAR